MPARIVVVHDDPEFIERTVTALVSAGHDVRAFSSSMSAIEALETAQRHQRQRDAVRLALRKDDPCHEHLYSKVKKPGVKVLFAARPDTEEHTEGVGEFLPSPADPADIVALIGRMLR